MQPAAANHGFPLAPRQPASREHATGFLSKNRPVETADDGRNPPVAVSVRNVGKTFRGGTSDPKTLKERLLTNLSSNTSKFLALDDVSFDIYQGETFGIIGHNGSGKSTLLKIIAGIMRPTTGEVLVAGRLAALLELGAGFHPELTGAENIHLNGSILGLEESYVDELFQDIVDFAEIEDFIHAPVKHYSSGMRARLGFSVATYLDPDVLLIDEVLSVGDEQFRRKCMERVHRFRSMGRTMILVSHSASTVAQLCQRSAVLSHGRLLHVGDSTEAIAIYRAALAAGRRRRGTAATTVEEPTEHRAVSIIDTRVVTGDDTEPTLNPGDDVTIEIKLEAFDQIEGRLRLAVKSEEGTVLINQASTPLLGRNLELEPGTATVTFTLHSVPLRDGTYTVDAIAESADGRTTLHRVGSACAFRIVSRNPHLGLVAVDLSCQLGDGSDPIGSSSGPTRDRSRTPQEVAQ
ncbi:MAG: ABC transporter ATP-binding protein [Acidimicrobiia bacterium]|nr:ABC transporter ATP-binding protein [Acidimicrobiia bacterium]